MIWILLLVSLSARFSCFACNNLDWRPFSLLNCSFSNCWAKFISSSDNSLPITILLNQNTFDLFFRGECTSTFSSFAERVRLTTFVCSSPLVLLHPGLKELREAISWQSVCISGGFRLTLGFSVSIASFTSRVSVEIILNNFLVFWHSNESTIRKVNSHGSWSPRQMSTLGFQ